MKITPFIKYGFLILTSMLLLTSCEKALDNSVPDGTPRRAFYNEQIKSYLTNDSIWVTQRLDKNSLILKVGFVFNKDKSVNLYRIDYRTLTLIEQLNQAKNVFTSPADIADINSLISAYNGIADATLRSLILTNPANASFLNRTQKYFPVTTVGPIGRSAISTGTNTYDVYGDFDSSLTFFNSSFLSDLKVSKNFDFDFLVNKYNRDSLVITSYYSQNSNRVATLKPIATITLEPHYNAFNIINSYPYASELKVNNVSIAGDGANYLKTNFSEQYDNVNKALAYIAKTGAGLDPAFASYTALKATEATYKLGDPKPAAGTVIAKFKTYNPKVKGGETLDVQIIAK